MTPARKRDFILLFINGFAPCVSKKLHQDHITTLFLALTTEKAQGAIKLGILLMGIKKNSNSRSLEGVERRRSSPRHRSLLAFCHSSRCSYKQKETMATQHSSTCTSTKTEHLVFPKRKKNTNSLSEKGFEKGFIVVVVVLVVRTIGTVSGMQAMKRYGNNYRNWSKRLSRF